MLFHPEWIAGLGVAAYLFAFLLAPIDIVFPVSYESIFYIVACYTAFICGTLIIRRTTLPPQSLSDRYKPAHFWAAVVIGSLGITARLYDKWILRGAALAESAIESREMLGDSSAGPLAAIGGLLYPFCYIPLILYWARPRSIHLSRTEGVIALSLFLLPALDALLLLSRSQLLVAISVMYFAAALVKYQGNLFEKKLSLPVITGFLSVLIASIIAFSSRLSEMELDIIVSILNSAYGYVVTPNSWALSILDDSRSVFSAMLAGILPILQYYVHGLFEFGLLWTRDDPQYYTFGLQHLAPFIKVATLIGADTDVLNLPIYPRDGVFTTFFGPLWTDFAWFGAPVMLLFGITTRHLSNKVLAGDLASVPLYTYLAVVVFFMPVVNFAISAQGMYAITAFVLFIALSKIL